MGSELSASLCPELIGESPAIREVRQLVERSIPTDASILLTGESGTGKGLLARLIHQRSLRQDSPLVVVDCAAIPRELMESELFGHEKGAFSGAIRQRRGRFEHAQGGTVFLDNVDDLQPGAQAALARFLQERSFHRVGGSEPIQVDVRFVAASSRDLRRAVRDGQLREDFFYRLSVMPIHLPPLRERREDIPLLAAHFIQRYRKQHDRRIERIDPEAIQALTLQPWPGNVRQLENVIERAVLVSDDACLRLGDLRLSHVETEQDLLDNAIGRLMSLEELEKEYIQLVLRKTRGNKTRAAQILGINRKTLLEKRRRFGLP